MYVHSHACTIMYILLPTLSYPPLLSHSTMTHICSTDTQALIGRLKRKSLQSAHRYYSQLCEWVLVRDVIDQETVNVKMALVLLPLQNHHHYLLHLVVRVTWV